MYSVTFRDFAAKFGVSNQGGYDCVACSTHGRDNKVR